MSFPIVDTRQRPLSDLRISVTDRCNFRCRYCMPREAFGDDFQFLPRAEILTFEEIARLSRVVARAGARKIRITGGEPLLRRDLPRLVELLAKIEGVDLALTTNGALLERHAAALASAGLDRITVSLDSVDPTRFSELCDTKIPLDDVLRGIDAAAAAGLTPVKINCVVRRGVNDDGIEAMVARFRGTGHVVRFIEFMDVGNTNRWQLDDVVTAREIAERIGRVDPIEPLSPSYRGEVARRWRFSDGSGEVGIIASVTKPFCRDCTRLRLSADGRLYPCLFSSVGTDVRTALRDGVSDDDLLSKVETVWRARDDRYSEERTDAKPRRRIEMSYIGG